MGDFLKKVLPWIGAAATGNVPVLIGLAAKSVGDAIGVDIPADVVAITKAVANATPEQLALLQEKENEFKLKCQALGFSHEEEMASIGLEEVKVYTADTQDARAKNAQNKSVFWLGVVVLLSFAGSMGAALYGSYGLLTGGIVVKDVGIVAAVFGFLGTIIGALAGNAQQVIGFFFGSSKGSGDKNDALAAAVKHLGEASK